MPKPFDATLKELIRRFPSDWLALLGVPITEPPVVLSAELSTVTAAADTLIRVGNRVIHIELEAGPDENLADRMLQYNVLAYRHTGLPVRSVAVLLRPNAQRANLTDRVAYEETRFRFELLKVWERSSEEFMTGGIGLLPLAAIARPPSGQTREEALPRLVGRIVNRVETESPSLAADVILSSYIVAGMHIQKRILQAIFQGVLAMHESVAYDIIMEEGAVAHMHKLILRLGRLKYGKATLEQKNKLNSIEDLERLDRMILRVARVKSWDALMRGR